MTRVLIVEDSPAASRLAVRCLERLGYEAFAAETVAAARENFEPGRFKIVLCDVRLPDGDGISLAAQLRDLDPGLTVVIMSGDPRNIERARAEGFKLVLPKPFEFDDLKAVLSGESPT